MDWKTFFIIAAPIIATLLGVCLNRYWENRPRLIVYLGHTASFKIRGEKETNVYTHSIILRNAGRSPAKNIKIGHQYFPEHYDISPPIEHETRSVPDSSKEIFIPTLVPNEQITISYLYQDPLSLDKVHSAIKFDEGFAKYIQVIPLQQFPKWVIRGYQFLAIIGFSALIYGTYEFAAFLFSLVKK